MWRYENYCLLLYKSLLKSLEILLQRLLILRKDFVQFFIVIVVELTLMWRIRTTAVCYVITVNHFYFSK